MRFLVCSSRNSKKFLDYVNNTDIVPSKIVLINHQEWEYTSIGDGFSFKNLVEYANRFEVPLYVINGSFAGSNTLHDDSDNFFRNVQPIEHYPYFIKMWYKSFDNDVFTYDKIETTDFKHLYITLNGKAHKHRCQQMDMLAKYDLINLGAISWNSPDMNNSSLDPDIQYTLKQYNFEYWKPQILNLDIYDDMKQGFRNRLPTHYNFSFMQLVSEATVKSLFITEKTIPALMKQKIFLVSSAMHFYKAMENYGFKLYDELFDYSFDNEPNDLVRFDKIAQNINNLRFCSNTELQNKYKQVYEKLVFNRNRCIELGLNDNLLPNFSRVFYSLNPQYKDW